MVGSSLHEACARKKLKTRLCLLLGETYFGSLHPVADGAFSEERQLDCQNIVNVIQASMFTEFMTYLVAVLDQNSSRN